MSVSNFGPVGCVDISGPTAMRKSRGDGRVRGSFALCFLFCLSVTALFKPSFMCSAGSHVPRRFEASDCGNQRPESGGAQVEPRGTRTAEVPSMAGSSGK